MFMKKLLAVFLISLLAFSTLAGCGGDPDVAVDPPEQSAEEPKDDSEFKEEDEKSEPEVDAVPLDPNLNYVDTEYMVNLMDTVRPVSDRTEYNQYVPEWDFVIVDSRPEVRYNEGHINGAINIPDSQFDQFKHLLPEDKSKELIFYCGGLECPLSAESARKAIELGYENVFVYQEGTPFWKEAGNYLVTTPEFVASLITEGSVTDLEANPFLIIDSRPYIVFIDAHIPFAQPMDDNLFEEKYLASMPADKDTLIISYCGGFFCGKSHNVAKILVANGYTNVKVLSGGVPAWKQASLPLFGAEGSSGFDLGNDDGADDIKRGLSGEEFESKLTSGDNVVVVDVRSSGERASGAIEGSLHIPDSEFHNDPDAVAAKLPDDKDTIILLHCSVGARSAGAVGKIVELGYNNAFYLDGRISIDIEGNYSF